MAELSKTHTRLIVGLAIGAGVLLLRQYAEPDAETPQEAPSRTVRVTCRFTVADLPAPARQMRIWVPVPPSNDDQRLHAINLAGDWPYTTVQEAGFGNRFLVIDIDPSSLSDAGQVAFAVRYLVTRYATRQQRRLLWGRPEAQDEPARYLAASRLIPIDGSIAVEARRVAGDQRDRLKQVRMLYDHIVSTVRYEESVPGGGRGDALYACSVRQGNSADFHSLFIGQARALGIPARFVVGLSLPEGQTEGPVAGYHCWGQFYLPGSGWCPIDASEASRFPQRRDEFFCGLDQHRVALSIGRDIRLPGAAAGPLNYVIHPHVEIDGQPHPNVRATFSFEEVAPGS